MRLATCCECVPSGVKAELRSSEIVFTGTITEVDSARVKFAVHRVYKGRVPVEFEMPNLVLGDCMAGFRAGAIQLGKELLVYAWHDKFFAEGFVTHYCSRTRSVEFAAEDLSKLGRGRPPDPQK